MAALRLTMACGPYDRAQALIDGSVRPEGIELDVQVGRDTKARVREVVGGQYDIAEFYMGAYIADHPAKGLGLTAIPVFVKRMFRHSYVYINAKGSIRSPEELNGKRIGIQSWGTTTAVWMKGILADEHGLDLRSAHWVAEFRGVAVPEWAEVELVPEGRTLHDMLLDGDLDAVITTRVWAPFGHEDITFLFADYPAAERDYYARTGFFPIMHVLVVRDEVLDRDPWVAMSLYRAWQESKARAYEWIEWQRIHHTGLWFRGLWEEERALAGEDPYVWGFDASRPELACLLDFSASQGLVSGQVQPEDLFHPSTLTT